MVNRAALQFLRTLRRMGVVIAVLIVLYLLATLGLSVIPRTGNPGQTGDIPVFLYSNGVHTDLVVPMNLGSVRWGERLGLPEDVARANPWLAFGWGNRAFYLNTPEWRDLTVGTAFRALFGLSPSAMHLTVWPIPPSGSRCRKGLIPHTRYLELVSWLESSLRHDKQGRALPIPTPPGYGSDSYFFEATGRYSLFNTCNSWANRGLGVAGLPGAVWTPFMQGIFIHYPAQTDSPAGIRHPSSQKSDRVDG